ncbi:MAG TPA: hypothetical protein PLX41_12355, partial [Bacteroidales bacterium]|nr:hypothetical protein [Bacteroidales bacterium]
MIDMNDIDSLNFIFPILVAGTTNVPLMRWPRSIHSQIEAVFHAIRAFGQPKKMNPLGIRSLGSWKVYRYEVHRLADYLASRECMNILETPQVENLMAEYLDEIFIRFQKRRLSRQTLMTILAAFAKFEHALNTYIGIYRIPAVELDTQKIRQSISKIARNKQNGLLKSNSEYFNRAYPDPDSLISSIKNLAHKLQAMLQREGGFRAEGVGAPSSGIPNPLTADQLGGIVTDPVTGEDIGLIKDVIEKGGKKTDHMVSVGTYHLLEMHITKHGRLESNYKEYVISLARAAKATGQYDPGRGTHALKHNFAQRRYLECVRHG